MLPSIWRADCVTDEGSTEIAGDGLKAIDFQLKVVKRATFLEESGGDSSPAVEAEAQRAAYYPVGRDSYILGIPWASRARMA